MITIRFFGLCAIGKVDGAKGQLKAWMPQTMGHQAVLSVRAEQCVIETSAAPDVLLHDGEQQILGWNFSGKSLSFSQGTGEARWNSRAKLLDLGAYHPGATLKTPGSAASLALPEGALNTGAHSETYDVARGTNPPTAMDIATSVVWNGQFGDLTDGDGFSVFFHDGADATITNELPDVNGERHFRCYYDELFSPPLPDGLLSLKRHTIQAAGPAPRTIHVYDCVPPVTLP